MKHTPYFLLRTVAIIQLFMAVILGVYSLGIGMAQSRSEDSFTRHKQEMKKAIEQAKTLEAQITLAPANFADEGYDNAVSAENFSTTVSIASIVLFGFGIVQLWMIQKSERAVRISS